MVSQKEMILKVITFRFLVLSQFFRDGMGLFKYRLCLFHQCNNLLYHLTDEYLEPVSADDPESGSGKFVLKHRRNISKSNTKYDKPSM